VRRDFARRRFHVGSLLIINILHVDSQQKRDVQLSNLAQLVASSKLFSVDHVESGV